MLTQEEDCDLEDDDMMSLVAADSYDGGADDDVHVDDDAPTNKRRKIVDRVNPEDYPQLAMFLRQNHLEEELQQNWTVVGNHNATMLEQNWIQIMNKQMDLAAAKMDLVGDIFELINNKANLFHLS